MNSFLTKVFLGTTSNQLESQKFKISLVNYTQRVSEEWHFHEKIHLSGIIQGGNLESRKRGDVQVSPGKIMIYEQGEIHRNRFTAHPSKNLNIELEEDFFQGDIHFSNLNLDENTNMELLSFYFELQLNDHYSLQSSEHILQSLFWTDQSKYKGEWVAKLKTILEDRWDEFIPLEELSDEIQIHPITISKYFPKYSGMTLSNYMRKIKVKKAVHRFINSSESFTAIAFACGFSDQSHMVRLVKKYTGLTPGAIRSLGSG